ncbi:hypothetical protein NKH10_23940 [Mesorhizobium sp. M1340]|uniref:hypothetical protein n=1 Tax=unclassified Mesorhizobium TaxID=325217 RepID=UPI0033368FBC
MSAAIYHGLSAQELVAVLEAKGILRPAEQQGLERQTIVKLAQRFNSEVLGFRSGVKELERAVAVALEVIARGERGDAVLVQVADKTRIRDFDGGASAITSATVWLRAIATLNDLIGLQPKFRRLPRQPAVGRRFAAVA